MPGGDGTGPMVRNPLSGWGRGNHGESGRGQVVGRGGGGGWGRRNRFRATGAFGWMHGQSAPSVQALAEPTIYAELRWLERRVADLEAQHQQITARREEFDRKPTD